MFSRRPLVEYASPYGLEVHFLYTFLAYFLLKNRLVLLENKIVSTFIKVLLIGYVVGFIINPILIMSKARTLTMLLSLILIFIFFTNLKNKVLLIILASLITGTFLLYSSGQTYNDSTALDSVTFRFQDTLELMKTNVYSADSSTAYRCRNKKCIWHVI